MGHIKAFFIYILFLNVLISCKSIHSHRNVAFSESKVHLLGHKGAGSNFGEINLHNENSLEAAIYGLAYLSGIELDIQMSKSGTLWLCHDNVIRCCNKHRAICIPATNDQEIEQYNNCKYNLEDIYKLEQVFAYHREAHIEKYISMDMKIWFPLKYYARVGPPGKFLDELASSTIKLVEEYQMHDYVMVESGNSYLLSRLNKHDVPVFLSGAYNLNKLAKRALQRNYQGISYKYKPGLSAMDVQTVRQKGLKVQLWTINEEEQLDHAFDIGPDFIQTDNVLYK